MFWKAKKKINYDDLHDPCADDFASIMHRTETMLQKIQELPQKIAFLDYIINAVKQELTGWGLYEIIRRDRNASFSTCRSFFPFGYNSGKNQKMWVSFTEADVLVIPYDERKLLSAIGDILREGFKEEKNAFYAFYLPEINLLIIANGRHHSAAAYAKKQGGVEAYITPLVEHLPVYKAEGVNWWENGKPLQCGASDFRGALIFELFRIRHELEQQQKEEKSGVISVTE